MPSAYEDLLNHFYDSAGCNINIVKTEKINKIEDK
jgi:hypothetical protein